MKKIEKAKIGDVVFVKYFGEYRMSVIISIVDTNYKWARKYKVKLANPYLNDTRKKTWSFQNIYSL